ncbi:MAG: hypothetical protein COB76_00540 [Alphaproteobacteria bacterium]|nr:MAG: hypothetical protein COB76_00540 [Alphaproteobacteria bacterium]
MSPEKSLSKLAITNVFTVSNDDTVEKALKALDSRGMRSAPVVDEDGVFYGMFSAHEVIKGLVPSYMDGMSLDFAQGFAPLLADRLQRMFPSRVGDHVRPENAVKIATNTHTWEALRMLTTHGSPLAIVDDRDGKLTGLISEQSAIDVLLKMAEKKEK